MAVASTKGRLLRVVLHEHLGNAAFIGSAQARTQEHVPEGQQEHPEEEGHDVTALEGGDGEGKRWRRNQ